VCICNLRYRAWYAHASYFHLWPGRLYNTFPHYLINGEIFGKKVIAHKMCIFIFSVSLSETFLILRRTERDTINMYCGLHVKYQSFPTDFNENEIFSTYFLDIYKISNFIKIRPAWNDLFHVDSRKGGRTDMKLTVAFRNFANPPKTTCQCPVV
jgi:hypothetical protein